MIKALALLAGVAALYCPTIVNAQDETADGLKLEAETRVMVEAYDNGFRANTTASDEVLYVRTRIAAAWKHGPVELGGELYDARAYWDDAATPITANEVNALELVQLYAAVDLTQQLRVTVGRQMFDLGSKRLVANPGYRNAPNAYTGIRAAWDGGDAGEGTVFYVLPQDRLPADKPSIVANDVAWDRESFDLALWGGIYTRPLAGKISGEIYFYGLDERDNGRRATRNRHLLTPGFRIFRKAAKGKWDGEVEVAGQFGTVRTSTAAEAAKVDVQAWTAHAELGYSIDAAWKPRVSVLADIASGDDRATADYERFDPLYGPRRGDWGPTGTYGPLGRANIRSVGLKLEARPVQGVDAFVIWRELWLDSATDAFAWTKLTDTTGAAGRDGGAQVEARVRWWMIPERLQLELGGAVLMKGEFFDGVSGVPDGDTTFGYTALHIKM